MMDLWKWIGGTVRLRLTGADLSMSLSKLMDAGIFMYDICWLDDLNCDVTVKYKNLNRLTGILEALGDEVKIFSVKGLPKFLRTAAVRPVLLGGIVLLIFLDLYLPTRILFFKVEGNLSVPDQMILEAAENIGLGFWSDRSSVRSEKIKNSLLESVPQLQWVGVNTNGCVATILVRERQNQEQTELGKEVSSIVAARDGVISSFTATRGNPLCKLGQAVRAGEVLISGYTDCGITIHATRAEGEVYAYTKHHFRAATPAMMGVKDEKIGEDKKYTLIIGKKRINFSKTSGISTPDCDKMIKQYHLELPGGFQLPVSIELESRIVYSMSESVVSEASAHSVLSDDSKNDLLQRMVAGQILQSDETITAEDGVYLLEGEYACMEMIGQVRKEEHYGEYD